MIELAFQEELEKIAAFPNPSGLFQRLRGMLGKRPPTVAPSPPAKPQLGSYTGEGITPGFREVSAEQWAQMYPPRIRIGQQMPTRLPRQPEAVVGARRGVAGPGELSPMQARIQGMSDVDLADLINERSGLVGVRNAYGTDMPFAVPGFGKYTPTSANPDQVVTELFKGGSVRNFALELHKLAMSKEAFAAELAGALGGGMIGAEITHALGQKAFGRGKGGFARSLAYSLPGDITGSIIGLGLVKKMKERKRRKQARRQQVKLAKQFGTNPGKNYGQTAATGGFSTKYRSAGVSNPKPARAPQLPGTKPIKGVGGLKPATEGMADNLTELRRGLSNIKTG